MPGWIGGDRYQRRRVGYNGSARPFTRNRRFSRYVPRNPPAQYRQMNRTITERAEKKHNHLSITENANIDQDGVFVKLSAIGQGQDNHDRVGAYCRAISFNMSFAFQPGTPNFVVVRMLIFQFHCDDDAPNNPKTSDVLENTLPDTDNALYSPYKQSNNNTRVLYDKLGYVCGETAANFKLMTGKILIPKSKMKVFRYQRAGQVTGSGMIYLLLLSTRLVLDADALKPTFSGISNIRFTDT